MDGERGFPSGGIPRQIQINDEVSSIGDVKVDGVTDEDGASWNGGASNAAEGEGALRCRLNGGTIITQSDAGGPDVQRQGAEAVGQHDPYARATDRDVGDLAKRLVLEVQRRRAADGKLLVGRGFAHGGRNIL